MDDKMHAILVEEPSGGLLRVLDFHPDAKSARAAVKQHGTGHFHVVKFLNRDVVVEEETVKKVNVDWGTQATRERGEE